MDTEWFKRRLKEVGKKHEDLAKAIDRERSIATKMVNTGRPPISLDQVHAFAEVYEVSSLEILFRAGFWENAPTPIVSAPILSAVEAGEFAEIRDEPPKSRQSSILVEYPRPTVIALPVEGDSMDRVAPAGSYIIIDYSLKDLSDGDLCVVRRAGEATFKRYRHDGETAWLEPDSSNPRHGPLFPEEDGIPVEIVGNVVDIRPEVRERTTV